MLPNPSGLNAHYRVEDLLEVMVKDQISLPQHVWQLRTDLAQHYHNSTFLRCETMGEVVKLSLQLVLQHSPAW